MRARHTGSCHNCNKLIEVGDVIRQDYDNVRESWRAVHGDCRAPGQRENNAL